MKCDFCRYTSNGVDGMAFKASKYSDRPEWPDIQLHLLSYSVATDNGVLTFEEIVILRLLNQKYFLSRYALENLWA